jgi:putative transposase
VGIYKVADFDLNAKLGSVPNMELVICHWSGKQNRGSSRESRFCHGSGWIQKALIPCDFGVYMTSLVGEKTKNEHFQAMLKKAKERGLEPEYVLMDSWYSRW